MLDCTTIGSTPHERRRVQSHDDRAQLGAAVLVLSGALLVGAGSRGYTLCGRGSPRSPRFRPPVLPRVKLLTRESLEENPGAAALISPRVHAYPMDRQEIEQLLLLPSVREMPGALSAVRVVK